MKITNCQSHLNDSIVD